MEQEQYNLIQIFTGIQQTIDLV